MRYLLDDRKVYIIVGCAFLFWLFIYCLPNTKNNTKYISPVNVITSIQPRYFNQEIYSLPNAKGDPYILYGASNNNINHHEPLKQGFERLLPIVENLPKVHNAYMLHQ